MLGSKEKNGGFSASSTTTTLISRDTEIVGDIKFCGSLDIEGVVRGNIVAQSGGKDAVVRIVNKGRVEGEIHAPEIIINGEIKGDVYSTKHLELASKAQVQGNVHYAQVEMVIGASVNGSLNHTIKQPEKSRTGRKQSVSPVPEEGDTPLAAVETSGDGGRQETTTALKS